MSQGRENQDQGTQTAADRRSRRQSSAVSRRAQRRLDEERSRRRQRLMLVGGAVVVAVVVVAALILLNRSDDGDNASDLAVTVPEARDPAIPTDGRTLGNSDAPVTIVEYADFQCPFCGDWARTVEPQLIQDYISTGQVKLEFHDFPFLDNRSDGNESDNASEAASCAQDQGKFWAYHDLLFYNQSGENEGAFARDRLIEMARNVEGLDVEQFTTCIDGDQHEDEVQAFYQSSVDAGINSTPSFVVNGQTVASGSNYDNLKQAIDAALGS